MHMFILSFHIIVAILTTAAIFGVLINAYQHRPTRSYPVMLGAFGATSISGIVLVMIAGGIGRLCAVMTTYTLVILATRYYYRKQTLSNVTL